MGIHIIVKGIENAKINPFIEELKKHGTPDVSSEDSGDGTIPFEKNTDGIETFLWSCRDIKDLKWAMGRMEDRLGVKITVVE